MNLATLLDETSKAYFLDRYFHKLPFTSTGTTRSVRELGTWDTIGEILQAPDPDVMVVRDGLQYTGELPKTLENALQLNDEGYTVLIRHAEQHHRALQELADNFRNELKAPVNIHIYATPAGRHGFSWHYDAEDVFIMQTTGAKEYSLRKNTVYPWPLVEAMPKNMRYERELTPLMKVLLRAGDWLYIPCGYWHKADALQADETAISLALGVMSPAAISIYDYLRPRLLESLIWRQRLPVVDAATNGQRDNEPEETANPATASQRSETADEQQETLDYVVEQLIEDFARTLRREKKRIQHNDWSAPEGEM